MFLIIFVYSVIYEHYVTKIILQLWSIYDFFIQVFPHEMRFRQDLLQLLGINMKFALEGKTNNTFIKSNIYN